VRLLSVAPDHESPATVMPSLISVIACSESFRTDHRTSSVQVGTSSGPDQTALVSVPWPCKPALRAKEMYARSYMAWLL
jgi:hypothetical protein